MPGPASAIAAASFGCAQQGCETGRRSTQSPEGCPLPLPKGELVFFPPPSPGQAAFLPFFFFLLFFPYQ